MWIDRLQCFHWYYVNRYYVFSVYTVPAGLSMSLRQKETQLLNFYEKIKN